MNFDRIKYTFLVLLIMSFSSCRSTIDESKISGKWMVEDLKVDAPELSPMLIEAAREDAISTIYSLNQNGTFKEISNYDPDGDNGLWEFHPSNNWLELTDPGISGQVFIVESVNSEKMIWVQEMKDLGSLMFTLKRID